MKNMLRRFPQSGWEGLVADVHRRDSGMAADVLAHSLCGRQNPYQWMARAVSASARLVLDIGCGCGRVSRELSAPGRTVIGVDLSIDELVSAAKRSCGPWASCGPWVQADATQLPFADGSLDAVTTMMGLAVIRPMDAVLGEVARVLRPGGVFVAVAPALRPQHLRSLRVEARVAQLLPGTPRFPGSQENAVGRLLEASGLTLAEDRRERYGYRVASREDAERLATAIYLPGIRPDRVGRAVDHLMERSDGIGLDVPIPVRRIVAVK